MTLLNLFQFASSAKFSPTQLPNDGEIDTGSVSIRIKREVLKISGGVKAAFDS